jgi:hypothetical protein
LFVAPGNFHDPQVQAAAVAPTGQIALLYATNGSGFSLYVAFLDSADDAGADSDAGAAGLVLNQVVQIDGSAASFDDPNHIIWSNASQAFVVSWVTYDANNGAAVSVAKFTAEGGATAGGVAVLPTDVANSAVAATYATGSAGESGNLLGVEYQSTLAPNDPSLTVLNTLGQQVGSTIAFAIGGPIGTTTNDSVWATVAGTAQGFVGFYQNPGANITSEPTGSVTEVFVPVSNGAVVGDGGITYPTFTFPGSSSAAWARAVSDDVGTGGNGGVGVAILNGQSSLQFAYVHANGVDHDGPVTALTGGPTGFGGEGISLTNFNGSFVMTMFNNNGTNSTQIVASGCP